MSDVHLLIKSMSKNEKRYFRLFASSFSKEDAEYLRLFEEIDKNPELEDKKLQKKLGIKHLAVSKKYLLENILKALRVYHSDKSPPFQVLDSFKNISLLKNRGLIKEAVKVYEKTQAQLIELNLFTFLIELLNVGEVLYRLHLPNKDLESKIREIEEQKISYIKEYENILQYQSLSQNLRYTWRQIYPIRNEEQENEILDILSSPLLSDSSNVLTSIAESYYYNSLIFCHSVLENFEEVKKHAETAILKILAEENKSFIRWKALMINLSNLLVACAKTRDKERFLKYNAIFLANKESIEKKPFDSQSVVINQKLYYNYTLNEYIEGKDYASAVAIEEEVRNFWNQNDGLLDTDWKITVSYLLAQALYQVEEYEKALNWVDYILGEEKNNPKTPSVCNARILNLLIHSKLENYFLLESLFRSTYRFLNKNERLFQCERLLLNYFKWLAENHSSESVPGKIEKLFTTLKQVCEGNKYENHFYQEMEPSLLKAFGREGLLT